MRKKIFLLLAISFAVHLLNPNPVLFARSSSSKEPPLELLQCKPALPYGCWTMPGDIPSILEEDAVLVFGKSELPDSEIIHTNGIFTFPQKGIYLITFGVTTKGTSNTFELQLSGKGVPGGKVTTLLDGSLSYSTGTVTVIISAKGKQAFSIVNTSGHAASLGTGEPNSTAATLSIVQIH